MIKYAQGYFVFFQCGIELQSRMSNLVHQSQGLNPLDLCHYVYVLIDS